MKIRNERRLIVSAVVLLITLVGFSGCERIKAAYGKNDIPGGPMGPGFAAPVFAVNTITATEGQIRDYLALSGNIMASSTVDTYSDATGKVSRLFVSVGSYVGRGDPIAEVDPSRPGMEFMPSRVNAPVGGTIIAIPVSVGMTISQAVPVARIAGGGGLEIQLFIAERFISKIAMNQPCEITLDAYPGEIFRGSVSEVSPTVDQASRTMEIRVDVDNPGARLKAGMFAKVRVITENKENIVKIPSTAVINRFGEQYVFSVDRSDPEKSVARRKVIVPGILIDGVMEVQQGLEPNEEIVVRGQTLLEEGSLVNVVERLSPLSAN